MDLSASGSTVSSEEEKAAYYEKVEALYAAIDEAPQTTIAMVDGPCYGGGVGLAFICDVRLVSSKARFTMTEVKLGLTPAIISKYMIREWGIPFAREAMLAGREVKPDELLRIGTLQKLVDSSEELETQTNEYLQNISASAPRSAAACKELIRLAWRDAGGPEQALKTAQVFARMMKPGSEGEHGLKHFRAKAKGGVDWTSFWAGKAASTPP